MTLKKTFEQTIIAMYGEDGLRWLQQMPSIIAELAARWNLVKLHPVPNLSYLLLYYFPLQFIR
jgi:streptomycin 6-kinase